MAAMIDLLWRASLQSGLALLVLALLCWLGARLPASARCWLWRAGYLKCLAALVFSTTLLIPLLPVREPVVPAPVKALAPAPAVAERVAPPVHITVQAVKKPTKPATFPILLTVVYLGGVGLSLLRLVAATVKTLTLVRQAITVEIPALSTLTQCFGLRRVPRVARLSGFRSPLLAFNTILLPEPSIEGESLILAHELAHLKRHDLFWELVGSLVQVIFWFHPLVWFARREEKLTREQAADALTLVITDAPRAEYARLLLTVTLRSTPALAVGAFENPSRLRRRFEALAQPALPRRSVLVFFTLSCLLALPALLPWRAVARVSVPKSELPPTNVPGVVEIQRGSVVDALGQRVAEAKVSWVALDWQGMKVFAETTTNAHGDFALPVRREKRLARPNGWIMVEADGFGRFVERRYKISDDLTVRLRPTQSQVATFRDTSGNPVTGLKVWVKELASNATTFPMRWLGYEGVTDAKGQFSVAGVTQTDLLTLRFDETNWRMADIGGSQPNHFRLTPSYALEGDLTLPDGRAASGALVEINGSGATRSIFASDRADGKGHFRIAGLAPGNYHLIHRENDYYEGVTLPNPYRFVIEESNRTTRLNLRFVPSALVIGTVITPGGKPVATQVSVNHAYTSTDKNGHYALTVPAGNATLVLGGTPRKTLSLSPKETQLIDLTVPVLER